jgi:hypothetical protein
VTGTHMSWAVEYQHSKLFQVVVMLLLWDTDETE